MDPPTSSIAIAQYDIAVRQVIDGLQAVTNYTEPQDDQKYFLKLRDAIAILQASHLDPKLLRGSLESNRLRTEPQKLSTWKSIGQRFLGHCRLELDGSWDEFTGYLIYATRQTTHIRLKDMGTWLERRKSDFSFTNNPQQWFDLNVS